VSEPPAEPAARADASPSSSPPPTSRQLAGSLVVVLLSATAVLVASGRVAPMRSVAPTAPAPAAATAASPPPTTTAQSAPAVASAGNDGDPTCAIVDPGPGPYEPAWRDLPIGRMVVPAPAPQGSYTLVLHLHGGEGARRTVAAAGLDVVLATVDLGVGSRVYAEAFYGPEPLEELIAAVDEALAPARLGHLVVSSWSAGYGGVRSILQQHPTTPSAVVLLDSVHASFQPNGDALATEGLEPFVHLFDRAKHNGAFVLLTHSAIVPPGFASTTEVADYLLAQVGGRRRYGGLTPAHGVELKTRYDEAMLHLRGYTGTGKGAHCAHLAMLGEVLAQDVLPGLAEL
jgi:hypothetical protein